MDKNYLDPLLTDCKQYMKSDVGNLLTMCSISALYESIRLRDPMTALHSMRVAEYSYHLAKRLDPSQAFEYFIGGLTHDVGKIAFPDSILRGNRVVAGYGKIKIQKHVRDSYEILSKLQLPSIVTNIARYHHERYNGSGYLEGLTANQIPYEARIAAVADVYCAITDEGRKYRQCRSHQEAIFILEQNADQFDPLILREFFRMMKSIDRSEIDAQSLDVGSILSMTTFKEASTHAI